LWRGWRVGMWGLVGMWTAKSLGGNGSSGGEF
jgi:fusion and transport protein UGO1